MPARALAPATELRRSFLSMLEDFDANDRSNAEFYAPAKDDFDAYVESLLDEEQGLNLREGWVRCTHRWLVDERNSIVGVTRLRHRVDTPFLAENGGHIGFDVRPSSRGRGFGHLAMQVSLERAVRLHIPRVLLFAAEDNLASRAVIERAGGVLEKVSYSGFWNAMLCKYWVSAAEA